MNEPTAGNPLPPPGPPPGPPEDPSLPEDNAALARRLVADAGHASLGTCLAPSHADQAHADRAGWPYTSLVQVASDARGCPILLLSDLAEHAANIAADPRVSLLFDGTADYEDRLAGPRLTVLGHAATTTDPAIRAQFLERHPNAALYAGFRDFRFYRVTMLRAHLVAGFGRIEWIDAAALMSASR